MAVSELRKKRLRALARLHSDFVGANLDAPFNVDARPGSGDYNVHHVDLEAGAAERDFSQRARQLVRGELDDELDELLA